MIKIKSITDVITNSSSEVFILDTPKTPEQVKEELSKFTSGFDDPFVFRLAEYRKVMDGEDNNDKWDSPYYTHINGWWTDPDDPEDMKDYVYDQIENAELIQKVSDDFVFGNRTAEEMQEREEYLNKLLSIINENLPALIEISRKEENDRLLPWWIKSDKMREISDYDLTSLFRHFKYYSDRSEFYRVLEGLLVQVPIPESFKVLKEHNDLTKLEGKVIVPCGENSCPYETWDRINSDYNGYNRHLG